MRKVGMWYVQDKSTPARSQTEEICRAILAAQPKPIAPKTAGQYSRESAKCFRQAVHLACCALKCWLKCFCKNLPNQLNFCRSVFRQQSKHEDSCPKSDAENQVLSNTKKVDAPGATGNHLLIWSFFPLPNLSLPQGLTFWLLLLCCVVCSLIYQSGYKRRVKP